MYFSVMEKLLFLAIFAHQALGQIQCGDNSTFCPSGSTCCPLDINTHYGCCPIPHAVCCEDKLHCCPSGMQCDTAHGQCTNGQIRLPMNTKFQPETKERSSEDSHESEESQETDTSPNRLVHMPSKTKSATHKVGVPLEASRRECSNGDSCNGESTCCYDRQNEEAYCCPTLKAKCCAGAKRCCPHGFRCGDYGDECVREENGVSITMNMLETVLSQGARASTDEEANWKSCPDRTRCPPKNTCCKTAFNAGLQTYRCCPLTHGVCCGSYCCPGGYGCTKTGQCEKSTYSSIFDSLFT